MSFPVFRMFLQEVESLLPVECVGNRGSAPNFMKVLAFLRYLGRGCTFDDVAEVTGIGEETIRLFTKQLCHSMANNLYSKWIGNYTQKPNEENINTYPNLPGCLGSTDGVHVRWDMCPALEANRHTGKAGYPTLAYNVTCNHHRRVLACTKHFKGARNDKTIVLYDSFVNRVKTDASFTQMPFNLFNSKGDLVEERGVYLLSDGGYRVWRVLQCPSKFGTEDGEPELSAMIESYRKDIECVFGILKRRFKFFKHPIMWRDEKDIDAAFIACLIIHNMLLEFNSAEIIQKAPFASKEEILAEFERFENDSDMSDDDNVEIGYIYNNFIDAELLDDKFEKREVLQAQNEADSSLDIYSKVGEAGICELRLISVLCVDC